MNSTNQLWQRLLDEACAQWSARPTDELKALPQITYHQAKSGSDEIEYALWHENPEKPNEDWGNGRTHSFVLQAHRNLFLCGCINYLAGFSLDENGAVIPVADDVIARYD